MKVKKVGIILIITFLMSSIAVNATSVDFKIVSMGGSTKSNPSAEWTIMVYLDGDNDLEKYAIDDFLEMASVGSTSDVNIVVQLDRVHYSDPFYDDTRYGDWDTTKRFHITQGMVPTPENAIQDIGEANMGDSQTVIDFANWAKGNYPANKYCFIFWDHGTGWKNGNNGPRKYVCIDVTSGDVLHLYEIRNALNVVTNSGANKIDLVGFDACLMGMIEVGYEIYQYAEYMTASEETEPVDGWNYQDTLSSLVTIPIMSAEELGAKFVSYYGGYDITLSTVNLGNYITFVYTVSELAVSLKFPQYKDEIKYVIQNVETYRDTDFVDLYHFAELITYEIDDQNIINKAQNVMYGINGVVTSEKHDNHNPNSHGISVYVPWYSYDPNYEYLLFAQHTQWDEFLHWYHGGNPGSPSPPVINGPTEGATGTEYIYTFTSTDPNGESIQYYVEWGDSSAGEYSELLPSGQPWEKAHTWDTNGFYTISAKAIDVNGAESEWSYYTVVMPRSKSMRPFERLINQFPMLKLIFQFPIFSKLLNLH